MKLVLFSDLHLDSSFSWMGQYGDAARRRRRALLETLSRIVQLTKDEQADVLLCGGDLYEHDRVTPDTAASLGKAFADVQPARVYISPGNHDWLGPGSVYRQGDWSSNVHIFQTERLEAAELADGLTLWGAAHRKSAGTDNFLKGFGVDRGGINLALFHGSESGWYVEQGAGKGVHAAFDAEEIRKAGLDHAFLGHYHRPREAPDYTYPGNPDPLEFGEDGERGAVVITVESDGKLDREWRHVAVSEVHDLSLDVTACTNLHAVQEGVLDTLRPLKGSVRITLEGDLDPTVDIRPRDLDFSSSADWLDGLVVRAGHLRVAYDLDAIAKEPTVKGRFVQDVMAPSGLTDDEKHRIIVTGLRALDGRSDLEVL